MPAPLAPSPLPPASRLPHLHQVLWASLRASARHLNSYGADTLAFGCMALAKKHEQEVYGLDGVVEDAVADRLVWLQQV